MSCINCVVILACSAAKAASSYVGRWCMKRSVFSDFCSVFSVEPGRIERPTSALPVLRPAQNSPRKIDSTAHGSFVHQMCVPRAWDCAAQSRGSRGGK